MGKSASRLDLVDTDGGPHSRQPDTSKMSGYVTGNASRRYYILHNPALILNPLWVSERELPTGAKGLEQSGSFPLYYFYCAVYLPLFSTIVYSSSSRLLILSLLDTSIIFASRLRRLSLQTLGHPRVLPNRSHPSNCRNFYQPRRSQDDRMPPWRRCSDLYRYYRRGTATRSPLAFVLITLFISFVVFFVRRYPSLGLGSHRSPPRAS